jgi:presenilin-like A22 family membrane protease
MNRRLAGGAGIAFVVFLAVQLGALALVAPFEAAGYQAFEDPGDPTNSLVYLVAILVVTGLMLAAFRFDLDTLIRYFIVFSGGVLAWYVFDVIVPTVTVANVNVLPIALAGAVALALLVYPEWYVIDVAGVLMGAGGAGLFGISFGLVPAVVLLVALAVYDAISVYGTEHMLTLASGVLDLKVPVVLVIPLSASYSLLDAEFGGDPTDSDGDEGAGETGRDDRADDGGDAPGHGDGAPTGAAGEGHAAADGGGGGADAAGVAHPEDDEGEGTTTAGDREDVGEADGQREDQSESESESEGEGGMADRDAFFIGLGDAVMPSVMVASAAFYSPAPALGVPFVPALNLPALLAMVGTFLGLGVLLRWVFRGRPHAGLPLLNGGAIGGYLLGTLAFSVSAGVPFVQALGI